jgi:cyanophycin synthetase
VDTLLEGKANGAAGEVLVSRLPPPPRNNLKVVETGVFRGPHYYSPLPMVRVQPDLGDLETWPTNKLGNFSNELQTRLPGLSEHHCCFNAPGGFLKRLAEGTWLGHVVEHVAIELQRMAGCEVACGKTRSVKGAHGVYNVMFRYIYEGVAFLAARHALELVNLLLPPPLQGIKDLHILGPSDVSGGTWTLPGAVKELSELRQSLDFGPTMAALVREAESRGIPVTRLDNNSLVQFGQDSTSAGCAAASRSAHPVLRLMLPVIRT